MKNMILRLVALLAIVCSQVSFAGMSDLYLAVSEAVATEFVGSDVDEEFYALMDNMEITGSAKTSVKGCDIVYEGKTVTVDGEEIFFDACVNVNSPYDFDIAISESQANN